MVGTVVLRVVDTRAYVYTKYTRAYIKYACVRMCTRAAALLLQLCTVESRAWAMGWVEGCLGQGLLCTWSTCVYCVQGVRVVCTIHNTQCLAWYVCVRKSVHHVRHMCVPYVVHMCVLCACTTCVSHMRTCGAGASHVRTVCRVYA